MKGYSSLRRSRKGGIALVSLVGLVVASASCGGNATTTGGGNKQGTVNQVAESPPPGGFITDFVKYVNGKPGAADKNLTPVKIGWSSNDGGGSVQAIGPQATKAAEISVNWVNQYAGGIDGHPLQLVECPILNAEEEGQACAEKFLADDQIKLISYGALSVGATTINSIDNGKKPIIEGFSVNNPDIKAKNLWALFAAGQFSTYAYGTFAVRPPFNAKHVAILYVDDPAVNIQVQGATLAAEAGGASVKAIPVDKNASDLVGAFTAAGAQTADIVIPFLDTPPQCLASAKALSSLNIAPTKVLWRTYCNQPTIQSQFPGGDYPKYYATVAQSGDGLANNPTGKAFAEALGKFGAQQYSLDTWYSGMFGQMLTIARFLNNIGYDHITTQAIIDQVKNWRGPQLLGGTQIDCGQFAFAPANCSTGAYLFRYLGNGKWSRVSQWTEPPKALMSYLEGLPANGDFPTKWPPK